jgi:hypothetical protein
MSPLARSLPTPAGLRIFSVLPGFQEALAGVALDAPVSQQIEVPIARLDEGEPHQLAAFDAWHVDGGFEACAGRSRPGYLQHLILVFAGEETQRQPL